MAKQRPILYDKSRLCRVGRACLAAAEVSDQLTAASEKYNITA